MEEFQLPVLFKGRELVFPARLLALGYIYKIEVDVDEATIVFERDEERNWRALADPSSRAFEKIDREVLQAIGVAIEKFSQ